MVTKQKLQLIREDDDRTYCPTCGMAVKIIRRSDGEADHYECLDNVEINQVLLPQDPTTAFMLKKQRAGKKTVAVVGGAPNSCAKAPYDDPEVEIWGMNEMHALGFMPRADKWFQIHAPVWFQRPIAKRKVEGHYEWLKENPWNIPIVMQHAYEEIPKSEEYPLHEICDLFLRNFYRGYDHVRYFTSSLAYMLAYAKYQGRGNDNKKIDRVEIYGFDLLETGEYVLQKACAEFWIGQLIASGIEVYTPPDCQILFSNLYGGAEQGLGW